jgi:hypothetical protein
METCILDLSQITYSWDTSRKILTMYSPTKEILTEVVMDQKREISDREAAFTACEKALDRSKLKRHAKDGKIYKVNLALYNPLSKEISVGSSQYNKIYSGIPLNIPAQGLLAKEVDDEFILEDGQHLYKVIPDFNHVTRILHTHREN